MSNTREILLDYISELLQNIVVLPYNTHPSVIRGMEHWNETVDLPTIIIDEGEPEQSEDIAFGWKQSTIDLVIIGRMEGEFKEANDFQEDIRIIMESTSNIHKGQCSLVSMQVKQDTASMAKEIEMHYVVQYEYEWGAA